MLEIKRYDVEPVNPELVLIAANKAYNSECGTEKWLLNWNWRFHNDSFENSHAFYIRNNNDIVSFLAISPVTVVQNNSKKLKAGLAIMGLTHPDYQGKGYYSQIYRHAEESASKLGYDCLLAFDNHNSHYPEVKYLNWRDIGLLTSFTLQCKEIRPYQEEAIHYNVIDSYIDDNLLQQLSLYYTSASEYRCSRDFTTLKWRFLNHPVNQYYARSLYIDNVLLASIIYKTYQGKSLDLMEVFFKNSLEGANYRYLHRLLNDMSIGNYDEINIWSNLQTEEHLALEKIGFQEKGFCAYYVCNPLNSHTDILDIRKWHYRFMDSDVY